MRKTLEGALVGFVIFCSGCCFSLDRNFRNYEIKECYVFDPNDLERNYYVEPIFAIKFYFKDKNKAEYGKFGANN